MAAKHSFDTRTPVTKFQDLWADYEDYLADKTSSRKATHFATTSWHLIDWLFSIYVPLEGPINGFESLHAYREDLYPRCPYLKIMHDIANGSKHAELSRAKSGIKETNKIIGDFDENDFNNEDFLVTRLEIEMEDGSILDFYNVAKEVAEFWKNYFNTVLGIYPAKNNR